MVNTHYHLDHTGGNAVFQKAGATILAQRNLRGWLNTENMKFFGANPKPEAESQVEALVKPDMVYSDAVDIYLGNRLVQVRYMLGHTGGDSVITVPDASVVFGGDLVLAETSTQLDRCHDGRMDKNARHSAFAPSLRDLRFRPRRCRHSAGCKRFP